VLVFGAARRNGEKRTDEGDENGRDEDEQRGDNVVGERRVLNRDDAREVAQRLGKAAGNKDFHHGAAAKLAREPRRSSAHDKEEHSGRCRQRNRRLKVKQAYAECMIGNMAQVRL